MNNIDFLDKTLEVTIDRPLGSKHPKHGFIYPVNYGYVPNTISGDGEELDCYILGIYEPIETFKGKCIAIIHRLNDNDDKWDIAPLSYPFGNGINFQLEVENLDEIYNNFKNSNYKITFDIAENWYRQDNKLLGNKEFLIQDPDGYLLRFSEDLGKKEV